MDVTITHWLNDKSPLNSNNHLLNIMHEKKLIIDVKIKELLFRCTVSLLLMRDKNDGGFIIC